MKTTKWVFLIITITLVWVIVLACASDGQITPSATEVSAGTDRNGSGQGMSSDELTTFVSSVPTLNARGSSNQQTGIWVTGQGKVTLEPDLAILSLGVETRADIVEKAMADAAKSMTGIIEALLDNGLDNNDIQTRHFNISPEYTHQEVRENDREYWKQILIGYRVTNTVTAKVRDVDIVGQAIDDVVTAGGDDVRIHGIQFTIEDFSNAQVLAREGAVIDALAKADQFAALTGVTIGSLQFITESGGGQPAVSNLRMESAAFAADSYDIPISGGELEVKVVIQAIFDIVSR